MKPASAICKKYNLHERILRKWKNEREIIKINADKNSSKNAKKKCTTVDFDTRLSAWLLATTAKGLPVSGPIIQKQALILNSEMGGPANFKASNGWLQKWLKRSNMKNLKVTGEKLSADEPAAHEFKIKFAETIAQKQLRRSQVFNMDETGLQFKLIPKRTYVPGETSQASGMKKQIDRVTVAGCCNADGTFKLPLIVIGKSKNPKCFKNINKDTDLPVWYRNQANAWMNVEIYEEWFSKEFVPQVENFLRSKGLPPTAILLVDNCRSHKYMKVNDIEVVFFPANVTSLIQPCDQGILENLKILYQKRLLDTMIEASSTNVNFNLLEYLKTIDLYKVVFWISDSWNDVKMSTIFKCWNAIWPVQKRDVATQTDEDLSAPDLLDSSVGTEAQSDLTTEKTEGIDNLLRLIKSVKGYEGTDASMLLKWLRRSSHDEPDDQLFSVSCATDEEQGNCNASEVSEYLESSETRHQYSNYLSESFGILYKEL